MQYTLGQAKKRLAASASAYGQDDLRDLINVAIQALAGMTGWECLRKVLRFSSAGPRFVLPQGSAGLVRVCVNGSPTTVRGQDFRFLQSGPGDARRPPRGFRPVRPENVYDVGMRPVMFDPLRPFRLMSFRDMGLDPFVNGNSDSESSEDTDSYGLVVKGVTPDGEVRTITLSSNKNPSYDGSGVKTDGVELSEAVPSPVVFQTILEVAVPEGAYEYYSLFAEDASSGARFLIGCYHPEVKAPQFRHYELIGVPRGHPVEILAETRIDPLPLVLDSDVLPFGAIEPVEWMIRADWQMKAGEITAASNYQNMAAKWLKAQEVTDDTIQTSVVVNSIFDGSPGEISAETMNI